MNKIYFILCLGIVCSQLFFSGCNKDEATIVAPVSCLTLIRDSSGVRTTLSETGGTIIAGESIVFKDCGSFDFSTFFNGKPGKTYDTDPATGVTSYGDKIQPRGDITVAYPDAGTYTVTMIAVNYSGTEPIRDIKKFTLTVLPKL